MDNCPGCGVSWIGGEIPKKQQHLYSGKHWKREIGIDGGMINIYDGLVALKCPDCHEYFPVSNHPFHQEVFTKFKEYLKSEGSI